LNYPILFKFLKGFHCKIFWTLHDPWAYTGHCSGYLLKNCSKFETGCQQCPALKGYPKSYGIDQSKRNYFLKRSLFQPLKDKITLIVPSEWLKFQIFLSFLKNFQVKLIHNGISIPELDKSKDNTYLSKYRRILSKKIVLGIAAYWEERKGLKFFLELASMTNIDYHIVIIGNVKRWQSKKSKNISFLGQIKNRSEINFLMSHSLCFVNPTLEDNFPTTNLEAQSCGIPVITFDTGGSKESISHNSGIVTKSKSVDSIHKAIEAIQKSKNQFTPQQCIANALNFNVDSFTIKYLELFKLGLISV
jgi:glycosyltransferase involved in cell wall biosynthesis